METNWSLPDFSLSLLICTSWWPTFWLIGLQCRGNMKLFLAPTFFGANKIASALNHFDLQHLSERLWNILFFQTFWCFVLFRVVSFVCFKMEKLIQQMRNRNYQEKNSTVHMTIHKLVDLALANTKMPNICEFFHTFDRLSMLLFIFDFSSNIPTSRFVFSSHHANLIQHFSTQCR